MQLYYDVQTHINPKEIYKNFDVEKTIRLNSSISKKMHVIKNYIYYDEPVKII